MTLTLTVDSAAWNRRVDGLAARIDGLIPVVKGNGYGFGREWLAERAAMLAPSMAVGTVHEVDSVPSNYTAIVLTPTLKTPPGLRSNAVLTVGSMVHIAAVEGSQRSVIVKIRSSMNRYGFPPSDVSAAVDECRRRDLHVVGVSIHPPLHGSSLEHRQEIETLMSNVDPSLAIHVSHLDEDQYHALRTAHPDRALFLRLGTSLWHGDKADLALSADVLDVHMIEAATVAGYRHTPVAPGSRIVVLGCGTAHGVTPLADGRSPFHFARQRLALLEPPHMHTSMCVVDGRQPCPAIGDSVDVQRPLTTTTVDIVHWT